MKKSILVIFSIIMILVVTVKVEAICTSRKYSNLKMTAYKSEVSYELKFDDQHNAYFEITVSNVDPSILVKFNGAIYEPVDGVVKIPTKLTGGLTYEVKLLGGYKTSCVEEYLYTKNITIPKYNAYSEREECIEYEEFYMCNKWYAGEIVDDTVFEIELEKYVQSLQKEEKKEEEKDRRNIIEKVIDFYKDHIEITLPITIIVIGFGLYKVVVKIIRRKNRIKLNQK